MFKCIMSGLVGAALAVAAMVTANPSYFAGTIPSMQEGSYRVYAVQPAFDSAGHSVFWITASKLKSRYMRDVGAVLDVDSEEVRLYSIPRDRVANPAEIEKMPSPLKGYKLQVLAGTLTRPVN